MSAALMCSRPALASVSFGYPNVTHTVSRSRHREQHPTSRSYSQILVTEGIRRQRLELAI